jgi:hypothetical protein
VTFDPPVPDLLLLDDGVAERGRWWVAVDGDRLTGRDWGATRTGEDVEVTLDVRDRWRPRHLPWLMRVVTTVVPVFRRWPTTYAWRGTVSRTRPGPAALRGTWRRTGDHDGGAYRRATGS